MASLLKGVRDPGSPADSVVWKNSGPRTLLSEGKDAFRNYGVAVNKNKTNRTT